MAPSLESNTSNETLSDTSYELGRPLRFWLFLVFDVASVSCSVFVLHHMLTKRGLQEALHNHALILILLFGLLYDLISIPLHLQFFNTGAVYPATHALCLFWWFIDWGFFYTITVLLLWTSIERHILIFHTWIVATPLKRMLFHYMPLLVIVVFIMAFYSVAIFIPPCENVFDYTMDLCGINACYETVPFFAMFEQLGFSAISSCLIAIFNMALLVRVIRQKYRVHRSIEWRKQRKMTVQVVSMSFLYLIFSFPPTLIYLVRLWGQSDWANEVMPTFFFLSYFAILFLPFVCLTSLPQLCTKIGNFDRQRRRVAPAVRR